MITYDLFQVVLAVAGIGCLVPIVLLFLLLRAVILLERFLFRRTLWLWLIPITVWLARNEQRDERQGCCPHESGYYK